MTYAETGLNPDLLAELKDAMHAAPGLEKQRRLEEMRACRLSFTDLLDAGQAPPTTTCVFTLEKCI